MSVYLMSPPGPDWTLVGRSNFSSVPAQPVDAVQARREWDALFQLITARGGTVHVLPWEPSLPGLPFAAEAGLPLPGKRFMLPKMRPAHRRPEATLWGPFVQALGYEVVPAPKDLFEGQGDHVSFAGKHLLFFGGHSARAGAEEAARQLGGEALLVQLRAPAFHGHVALLPLGAADRVMLCPDVIGATSLAQLEAVLRGERFLRITLDELRTYATNSLIVGDTLIATHLLPERLAMLFDKLGYRVERLDMPELCEKGGGAARCLVCEL